jgi:O-antigen ligase
VNPTVAESHSPSHALWLPLAWYFIVSTRAISSWFGGPLVRGTSDVDVMSGSPLDRLILTALICLGCLVLVRRRTAMGPILSRNMWLVALFIEIVVSAAWSYFPAVSLRRAVRCVGTAVMALVVLTERRPLESAVALLRRCYVVHLVLSLIAIKYFRHIGVSWSYDGSQEEWTGLALHKNNLGQVVMMSGLFFSWCLLTGPNRGILARARDLSCLALSVYLLRGSGTSNSITSIVAFAVGVCVLMALWSVRNQVERVTRYAGALVLAVVLMGGASYIAMQSLGEQPVGAALGAAGRDETLSGRTGLWLDLLAIAGRHPVLGVGYGAFWVGPAGYDIFPLPNWSSETPEWRPLQGHNGYIDVYVELGVIGVALLLVVIAVGLWSNQRLLTTDFAFGSLRLAVLISLLINNLAESSFLRGTHNLWFLFLLVAINFVSSPSESGRTTALSRPAGRPRPWAPRAAVARPNEPRVGGWSLP